MDYAISHGISSLLDTQQRMYAQGDKGGGIAANGGGILRDLVSLATTPEDQARERAARLAGFAEEYGPEIAAEQHIPLEEAKASVTEGVAPAEPGYRPLARATLGRLGIGDWSPPPGEPYQVRAARLTGMANRFTRQDAERPHDIAGLSELLKALPEMQNPEALAGALSSLSQRAGIGDVGAVRPLPRQAKTEFEAAMAQPESYAAFLNAQAASKLQGQKPEAWQYLADALNSGDEGRIGQARELADMLHHGNTASDPGTTAAIRALMPDAADEWKALQAWKAKGGKGTRPPTPAIDQLRKLTTTPLFRDADLEPNADQDVRDLLPDYLQGRSSPPSSLERPQE